VDRRIGSINFDFELVRPFPLSNVACSAAKAKALTRSLASLIIIEA
jgi:hypothetical protein